MKKLLNLFALALAVTVGFTSCDDQKYDDDPYAAGYTPGATTLNTDHALVGKLYGENGAVENWKEALGIVFAVSPDGTTAYLCAFTDLFSGSGKINTVWNSSNKEWGKLAKVNEMRELGCKNADGSVNTDIIVADTTVTGSAAAGCRDYYPRAFDKEDRLSDPDVERASLKGTYYLPSAEELEALVKNAEKINDMYLVYEGVDASGNKVNMKANPTDTVMTSIIGGTRFQGLGGDYGYAYWSSTEFNNKCAWYRIVNKNKDGDQLSGYLDKSIATGGGKGNMHVRPICKVAVK